jgi:hypothetical protein
VDGCCLSVEVPCLEADESSDVAFGTGGYQGSAVDAEAECSGGGKPAANCWSSVGSSRSRRVLLYKVEGGRWAHSLDKRDAESQHGGRHEGRPYCTPGTVLGPCQFPGQMIGFWG